MRNIKILLADDHAIVMEGLKEVLSADEEISVVGCVQNGEEVLRFIKNNEVDIVILDINMPVMNGFEFLDRYAQEFSVHAPVVAMLTSSHLGKDRERAMGYSFVKSYFEKPLQADHLRLMAELLQG